MKKYMLFLVSALVILGMVACATPVAKAPAAAPVVAATAAPAKAPAEVKIGALFPLTGSMALNGEHSKIAIDYAVAEINAAGGIKCLGGAPLKVFYGDHQGKPEAGNAEVERLITKEGVSILIGTSDSGVGITATEFSERYKIPFIISSALAEVITSRGLKYVFKTATSMNPLAKVNADFAKKEGAVTALLLIPNNTFGVEMDKALKVGVPAAGLTIVSDLTYAGGATDYSDTILAMKKADPDVVLFVGDSSDVILMLRQMKEQGYFPKQALLGASGGVSDNSVSQALGAAAMEGLYDVSGWFEAMVIPGSKEINDAFVKKNGFNMGGGVNGIYASVYVIAAALEKACSTDPEKITEVLRTTTFEKGAWNPMGYPSIKFNSQGMNETTPHLVAQFQKGVWYPVYPDLYKVVEPVWPVPAWRK